ncbi:Synaptonemal complex central element protein 1, partial [Nibea albiflora]
AKSVLDGEMKEIKSVSDSLQKELGTLQNEAYQLEEIHKEKEELCRKLQFQCDESEQDCARQFEQNKRSDELLEQYTCDIQEFKLKQRKQRYLFIKQMKLAQLHRLNEELEEVRKEKQLGATAGETQDE